MLNKIKAATATLATSATLLSTNIALGAYNPDSQNDSKIPLDVDPDLTRGINRGDAGFLGTTELLGVVQNVLDVILGFGALVAVIYIIWAGFDYITSAGDVEKAQKARSKIINAIIGLIIIALAFGIKDYAYGIITGAAFGKSPNAEIY